MKFENTLCEMLKIELPIIMAPMFLVSNQSMVESAIKKGIAGTFPTLNYRDYEALNGVLDNLNKIYLAQESGTYGVNLIVQKSNPFYKKHLAICVEKKVPFYITSLGNPTEVIEAAHSYGARVFCDVTNIEHAQKVNDLGCDGFIAVGQGAGGHAGPYPLQVLVPALKEKFPSKIIIAAGGIATGAGILSMLCLGAEGVSIGTRFIASHEASVSKEYKESVVLSGMEDIVLSEKLSGTPCTIINTDYAKKIGYRQNFIERLLSNNKISKKYFKMFVQLKGMKKLAQSIKPGNYSNLWCAGQSVALIHEVESVEKIIETLKADTQSAFQRVSLLFK